MLPVVLPSWQSLTGNQQSRNLQPLPTPLPSGDPVSLPCPSWCSSSASSAPMASRNWRVNGAGGMGVLPGAAGPSRSLCPAAVRSTTLANAWENRYPGLARQGECVCAHHCKAEYRRVLWRFITGTLFIYCMFLHLENKVLKGKVAPDYTTVLGSWQVLREYCWNNEEKLPVIERRGDSMKKMASLFLPFRFA